ncbi:MAG: glycoside hydrolase family 32 protein [Actinomycetota bacterium]
MSDDRSRCAPAAPVVHLAPPSGWLNDPNGLHVRDGTWHAYYQHEPDHDVWGPMHWRHATSTDLMRWTDHGIVLSPTAAGMMFSGCVVIDHHGRAGFGSGQRIAVLTIASEQDQVQALATSPDGYTWELFDGNPVLADGACPDFRDPSVVDMGDEWLMALAVGPVVGFYRSDNLQTWRACGEFDPELPSGYVVECPDLIEVVDDLDRPRWVLTYGSLLGPLRTSETHAAVGDIVDGRFVASSAAIRLDHGPDFYAAQTYHGTETTVAVMHAWMGNWAYALEVPSAGRRGVLTSPRSLAVSGDTLRCEPLASLGSCFSDRIVGGRWSSNRSQAALVRGNEFTVMLAGVDGDEAYVAAGPDEIEVARRPIKNANDREWERVVFSNDGGEVLAVFDHGTLEVFAAGGACSMLTFPGDSWRLTLGGDGCIFATPPPDRLTRG